MALNALFCHWNSSHHYIRAVTTSYLAYFANIVGAPRYSSSFWMQKRSFTHEMDVKNAHNIIEAVRAYFAHSHFCVMDHSLHGKTNYNTLQTLLFLQNVQDLTLCTVIFFIHFHVFLWKTTVIFKSPYFIWKMWKI